MPSALGTFRAQREAAGAGYAAVARPWTAEMTAVRIRLDFAEFIEHRVITMTPGERRQFDSLMKRNESTKR
jgi:hypothetical protein